MTDPRRDFIGAKAMVFLGPDLLVLRRDHTPGIAWPGRLDFPGGGREDGESPEACALRETEEEVGLRLDPASLELVHLREGAAGIGWFFAVHLPPEAVRDVAFGGEGAGWLVMAPQDYVTAPDGIPPFQRILAAYLAERAVLKKDRGA